MIYPVPVRGIDPDTCEQLPDITISVPGGYCSAFESYPGAPMRCNVVLPQIDVIKFPCVTRQKIVIQKAAPNTKTSLLFHIPIVNSVLRDSYHGFKVTSPPALLPRKHIMDIEIYGANGINGFIPGDRSQNSLWPFSSEGCPTSLSQIFDLSSEGGSEYNYKYIEHDWFEGDISSNSDLYFNSNEIDQRYTRNCNLTHLTACLGKIGIQGSTLPRSILFIDRCKALNMFYSSSGICYIRATLEIDAAGERTITLEKGTGAPNKIT
ncbi:MAG: hypothetical protein LBR74_05735 [Eubacterium sp.]|nr:hypothetical protein [Eubacterium sp.]